MQALALGTAQPQLPAAVAFRPAARLSGRQLRLAVCSSFSSDRPSYPSRSGPSTGTTPRPGGGPSGPRPGGGPSGPRPGGGPPGPRTGGGPGGPRPGGPPGSRPGGPPGSRPYTPRPGGGGGGNFRGGRGGGGGTNTRQRREAAVPMNENIRASEVRLLAEDKTPLGVMSLEDALAEARLAGVDLILIVPDAQPPVCRLMDFSKYNYELEKAAKEAKKKQRESVVETKEVKLRPATDVHDYQVKVRSAQKFLVKGHRVKLTLQFRGREMEFQQIGREMFQRFVEDCGGADEVTIEQAPQMQGRQMSMVLAPKKQVPAAAAA